jgi:hypothetical protein
MDLKSIPWVLAKGKQDGHSLMMRFRQFSQDFPKQEYPVRINMVCDVKEQTSTGLPTRNEYQRLGEFEEHLMSAVEDDEESVLAMVITSSGKREFIFQTADAETFKQRLSDVYERDGDYRVDLMQSDDDDWEYINDFTPKE